MDAPKQLVVACEEGSCGPPLPPPRHPSPLARLRAVPFGAWFRNGLRATPAFSTEFFVECRSAEPQLFVDRLLCEPVYDLGPREVVDNEDNDNAVCYAACLPFAFLAYLIVWILWVPYHVLLFLGGFVELAFGVVWPVARFVWDTVAWALELAARWATRLAYFFGLRRSSPPSDADQASDKASDKASEQA